MSGIATLASIVFNVVAFGVGIGTIIASVLTLISSANSTFGGKKLVRGVITATMILALSMLLGMEKTAYIWIVALITMIIAGVKNAV